jgi:hypothetical protein
MPMSTRRRYRSVMTVDPRAALDRLQAALEAHYHAVSMRRGDDDPKVDHAYEVLADAFEVYDDALLRLYGENTPFYLADEDEDDDEDDEDGDDLDDDDDLDGVELEEDGG